MLSGGERARLTLAKLILSEMNLLILDEPTNHLDIMSREALEQALDEFGGTILIVSHDRYLVNKLATRVIEIDNEKSTGQYYIDYPVWSVGNAFAEYIAHKTSHTITNDAINEEKAPTAQKEDFMARKKQAADARREQKRIENLKKEQEKIEKELEQIEIDLFGEAATDYKKAAELTAHKDELEERLMEIYEELE